MPQPASPRREWTVEEVLQLPEDGTRYELLDGELFVNPAPRPVHQRVARALFLELHAYLASDGHFDVHFAPADFPFGSRNLVEPDLFVTPATTDRHADWPTLGELPLVIEILSPTTAARDRGRKRTLYQESGVAEYWIVDPDARLVERWRPGDERPEVVHDALDWRAPGAADATRINLGAVFG